MKGGLSCVALAFGLLIETSFALGQRANPTVVAQGPSSAPPSGILTAPPPAPVFVPPSGVLPNVERHGGAVRPLKTARQIHVAKKSAPISTRHHNNVASHSVSRHHTVTRPISVAQRMTPTPTLVNSAAAEPRHDEEGFEAFLPQLGKAKEAR